MKRVLIIGSPLVVALLVTGFIYWGCQSSGPKTFPITRSTENKAEVIIYLNVFLSKKNCSDCLEIIDVLNSLPDQFSVQGIVPPEQLADEKELREITGATFPLVAQTNKYKGFIPLYYPATVGVSPKGHVLFVLPGVPGQKKYLVNFLESLHSKTYPILLSGKI